VTTESVVFCTFKSYYGMEGVQKHFFLTISITYFKVHSFKTCKSSFSKTQKDTLFLFPQSSMTDWKFLYVNNKLAIFQPYLKTEKMKNANLVS